MEINVYDACIFLIAIVCVAMFVGRIADIIMPVVPPINFEFLDDHFENMRLNTALEHEKSTSRLSAKIQALNAQQRLVEHGYDTSLDFNNGVFTLTGLLVKPGGRLDLRIEFKEKAET